MLAPDRSTANRAAVPSLVSPVSRTYVFPILAVLAVLQIVRPAPSRCSSLPGAFPISRDRGLTPYLSLRFELTAES